MQKQFVLKARETVKRVAAITAGATLLGATAMGAVAAADLGDYPAPFVADGSLVGLVVVGSDAAAGDIVGAGDIISTLTQAAVTTVAGTGTTEVTGGVNKDVLIGTALNDATAWSSGVDDDDLASLIDSKVNIDLGSDKDYDVHEAITFTSGASVESGTTTVSPSENFGTTTFLEMDKDSIVYKYVFDDQIDAGNRLNDTSTANTISLTILGQELEVSGATATQLTVSAATEYYMHVGDSVVVDSKTVTLLEVGSSSSVVVDVDGVTGVIGTTTKTVNGIKLQGQDFFSKDAIGAGSATIKIGDEISQTYKNGDEYIGEDEDDPRWVWNLAGLNTASPTIQVEWDQIINDADDDHLISVENGLAVTLPNDYAQIYLNKYTQMDRQEYKISFETGEEIYGSDAVLDSAGARIADNTNANVMHWEAVGATGDDAFTVNGNKTDDIWVELYGTGDSSVLLYSFNTSNNKIVLVQNVTGNATAFTIDFKDTSLNVAIQSIWEGEYNWSVDDEGGHGDIVINTEASSNDFKYLGETDSDTTVANDILYNSLDISGWKEDTRTERGFIISSYYDSDSADEFVFSVPGDNGDYDVEVIVSGTGSTVSTTGGSQQINSAAGIAIVKLDSEISDPTATNLILVGGPAVNSLTARALGLEYPSAGAASTVPENAAMLKLVSNAFGGTNSALVVAGWEASNTRDAAQYLRDYELNSLSGMSMTVTGPSTATVGGEATAETTA